MCDYTVIEEDWLELKKDFKQLEETNKIYLQKLDECTEYRKKCEQQIQHQHYRLKQIKKTLPSASKLLITNSESSKIVELKENIIKHEIDLLNIEQTLPKTTGNYLKIILGNINVSILNNDDLLKYKSEYEMFKLILSLVAATFATLNLFVINRLLERIYLFVLVWYYFTLTIRESILKVNGSRIKGWWRMHHFISMITSAILLIWPESRTWTEFRQLFMIFNLYLSVVQYLQFKYQSGVLYRLKALGERHNMDITIEGFHAWMWKGLSFLFPFLFVVYAFQLYISYTLYCLSCLAGATWHVYVLSVLFFVLFIGNVTTILMVVPDKVKDNIRLKYRILSQRLKYGTTMTKIKK